MYCAPLNHSDNSIVDHHTHWVWSQSNRQLELKGPYPTGACFIIFFHTTNNNTLVLLLVVWKKNYETSACAIPPCMRALIKAHPQQGLLDLSVFIISSFLQNHPAIFYSNLITLKIFRFSNENSNLFKLLDTPDSRKVRKFVKWWKYLALAHSCSLHHL